MEERLLNDLERRVLLVSERNDLEVEKLVFEKAKAKRSIYSLAFSKEAVCSRSAQQQQDPGSLQLEVLDASMDMAEAAAKRIVASKPANAQTPRSLLIQMVTSEERELEEEVKNLNSALELIWGDAGPNTRPEDLQPTPAPPTEAGTSKWTQKLDENISGNPFLSSSISGRAHLEENTVEVAAHEGGSSSAHHGTTNRVAKRSTITGNKSNVASRERQRSKISMSSRRMEKVANKALQRKSSLVTSMQKMDAKLLVTESKMKKSTRGSSLMRPTASSMRRRASAVMKSRKAYKSKKRKRASRGTGRGESAPPSSRFAETRREEIEKVLELDPLQVVEAANMTFQSDVLKAPKIHYEELYVAPTSARAPESPMVNKSFFSGKGGGMGLDWTKVRGATSAHSQTGTFFAQEKSSFGGRSFSALRKEQLQRAATSEYASGYLDSAFDVDFGEKVESVMAPKLPANPSNMSTKETLRRVDLEISKFKASLVAFGAGPLLERAEEEQKAEEERDAEEAEEARRRRERGPKPLLDPKWRRRLTLDENHLERERAKLYAEYASACNVPLQGSDEAAALREKGEESPIEVFLDFRKTLGAKQARPIDPDSLKVRLRSPSQINRDAYLKAVERGETHVEPGKNTADRALLERGVTNTSKKQGTGPLTSSEMLNIKLEEFISEEEKVHVSEAANCEAGSEAILSSEEGTGVANSERVSISRRGKRLSIRSNKGGAMRRTSRSFSTGDLPHDDNSENAVSRTSNLLSMLRKQHEERRLEGFEPRWEGRNTTLENIADDDADTIGRGDTTDAESGRETKEYAEEKGNPHHFREEVQPVDQFVEIVAEELDASSDLVDRIESGVAENPIGSSLEETLEQAQEDNLDEEGKDLDEVVEEKAIVGEEGEEEARNYEGGYWQRQEREKRQQKVSERRLEEDFLRRRSENDAEEDGGIISAVTEVDEVAPSSRITVHEEEKNADKERKSVVKANQKEDITRGVENMQTPEEHRAPAHERRNEDSQVPVDDSTEKEMALPYEHGEEKRFESLLSSMNSGLNLELDAIDENGVDDSDESDDGSISSRRSSRRSRSSSRLRSSRRDSDKQQGRARSASGSALLAVIRANEKSSTEVSTNSTASVSSSRTSVAGSTETRRSSAKALLSLIKGTTSKEIGESGKETSPSGILLSPSTDSRGASPVQRTRKRASSASQELLGLIKSSKQKDQAASRSRSSSLARSRNSSVSSTGNGASASAEAVELSIFKRKPRSRSSSSTGTAPASGAAVAVVAAAAAAVAVKVPPKTKSLPPPPVPELPPMRASLWENADDVDDDDDDNDDDDDDDENATAIALPTEATRRMSKLKLKPPPPPGRPPFGSPKREGRKGKESVPLAEEESTTPSHNHGHRRNYSAEVGEDEWASDFSPKIRPKVSLIEAMKGVEIMAEKAKKGDAQEDKVLMSARSERKSSFRASLAAFERRASANVQEYKTKKAPMPAATMISSSPLPSSSSAPAPIASAPATTPASGSRAVRRKVSLSELMKASEKKENGAAMQTMASSAGPAVSKESTSMPAVVPVPSPAPAPRQATKGPSMKKRPSIKKLPPRKLPSAAGKPAKPAKPPAPSRPRVKAKPKATTVATVKTETSTSLGYSGSPLPPPPLAEDAEDISDMALPPPSDLPSHLADAVPPPPSSLLPPPPSLMPPPSTVSFPAPGVPPPPPPPAMDEDDAISMGLPPPATPPPEMEMPAPSRKISKGPSRKAPPVPAGPPPAGKPLPPPKPRGKRPSKKSSAAALAVLPPPPGRSKTVSMLPPPPSSRPAPPVGAPPGMSSTSRKKPAASALRPPPPMRPPPGKSSKRKARGHR